jgi:catechol 2,3-dioxygenase-like lactoylglutathione lyase family enzyme
MENTGAMLAFYRALGCDVIEHATAYSVHFGDNMINYVRDPDGNLLEFMIYP